MKNTIATTSGIQAAMGADVIAQTKNVKGNAAIAATVIASFIGAVYRIWATP